jgi:hypothetical protein
MSTSVAPAKWDQIAAWLERNPHKKDGLPAPPAPCLYIVPEPDDVDTEPTASTASVPVAPVPTKETVITVQAVQAKAETYQRIPMGTVGSEDPIVMAVMWKLYPMHRMMDASRAAIACEVTRHELAQQVGAFYAKHTQPCKWRGWTKKQLATLLHLTAKSPADTEQLRHVFCTMQKVRVWLVDYGSKTWTAYPPLLPMTHDGTRWNTEAQAADSLWLPATAPSVAIELHGGEVLALASSTNKDWSPDMDTTLKPHVQVQRKDATGWTLAELKAAAAELSASGWQSLKKDALLTWVLEKAMVKAYN